MVTIHATKTIRGTWQEVQAATQEIAPSSEVELTVYEAAEETHADPTLELMEEWRREAEQSSSEERDADSAVWQRFEHNLRQTRQDLGMRPL